MADTASPTPAYAARDQVVTKQEFAILAALAWLNDPSQALATQMSADTGIQLRSCQYWLNLDSPRHAPANIVARAVDLANQRFPALADLLDRLAPGS